MYCLNGNSIWYIDCCPLYGRCPLLGVSIIGGSTVVGRSVVYYIIAELLSACIIFYMSFPVLAFISLCIVYCQSVMI